MSYVSDSSGWEKVLKSAGVSAMVKAAADGVAASARSERPDDPIEVNTYTTDRAAASVTIAHPKGLAVQAKHGTLTRAAAAQGLEVTEP